MTEIHLIGIGTGNPDHITRQAARAITEADLILVPHKGADKSDLADLRYQIITELRPDAPTAAFDMPVRDPSLPYLDRVDAWHAQIARIWADTLAAHPAATRVALLVWGDPSLYDSTLRIAARLAPQLTIRVIPGITAVQALTAAHAIPLNDVGAPVTITTGRQLRANGWPAHVDTMVVMLDGEQSFTTLDPAHFDIWWGAYLGMAEEILIAGPLDQVQEQIIETRAAARENHGWIMDCYLLRRRASPGQ